MHKAAGSLSHDCTLAKNRAFIIVRGRRGCTYVHKRVLRRFVWSINSPLSRGRVGLCIKAPRIDVICNRCFISFSVVLFRIQIHINVQYLPLYLFHDLGFIFSIKSFSGVTYISFRRRPPRMLCPISNRKRPMFSRTHSSPIQPVILQMGRPLNTI